MIKSDQFSIYMHDGRIIRLDLDANERMDLTKSFANRMASSTGGGSITVSAPDRNYVINVAFVAFIEAAK